MPEGLWGCPAHPAGPRTAPWRPGGPEATRTGPGPQRIGEVLPLPLWSLPERGHLSSNRLAWFSFWESGASLCAVNLVYSPSSLRPGLLPILFLLETCPCGPTARPLGRPRPFPRQMAPSGCSCAPRTRRSACRGHSAQFWRPGAPWTCCRGTAGPQRGNAGHFRNVRPLEKPVEHCWGWELGPEGSCSVLLTSAGLWVVPSRRCMGWALCSAPCTIRAPCLAHFPGS